MDFKSYGKLFRLREKAFAGGVLCLMASGMLVGSKNPAYAHPVAAPFWGPTGLGSMPTADTVPQDQLELGLNYENVDPTVGDVRFFPVITANYGLSRGEVGVAYARERTTAPGITLKSDYVTAHGKWRFLGDANSAQAAVGAHYLNFHSAPGSLTSLYLTGSIPLWRRAGQPLLRGHLGVIHHRIKGFAPDNETRPMVGLEWRPAGNFVLAGDYIPRKGQTASITSIVARYERGALSAQIGAGQFRGDDNRLFAGVAYRFDTKKSQQSNSGGFNAAPAFGAQEATR
jgi:hypothetical protein